MSATQGTINIIANRWMAVMGKCLNWQSSGAHHKTGRARFWFESKLFQDAGSRPDDVRVSRMPHRERKSLLKTACRKFRPMPMVCSETFNVICGRGICASVTI